MDCSLVYNITQNDLYERFENVTNSNYIVGFLSIFAVGITTCYYIIINRRVNKIMDKIVNSYPPLYSEVTQLPV